jgi:hypothetical protein
MKILFYLFVLISLVSCKESYDLPLRSTDQSLLVVEGVLNAGTGATIMTLSKTSNVNDRVQFKPELKAKLTVEGKSGNIYPIPEANGGKYTNSQLPLSLGQEYRLRIKTIDGKEYLSDYVVARQSPTFDSLNWKKESDGAIIYVSSHDPANATRYYKWEFDETWEIRSFYTADYEYIGGTTIIYNPMYHFRCWKYSSSSSINIGSSAQLQTDVIHELPIQMIPYGSEKIGVRYSVLVRQQSLTKEAYEYFKLMKKNTESIGSIFDSQPSELKGNIHCVTNSAEGVIGYLTASSFQEKRMFITSQEAGWNFTQSCSYERVKNKPDSLSGLFPHNLPWGAEETFPGVVNYYYIAPAACVDCTKRGGDLAMPSYW